jgi:ribosomal protein S18 acetylase RimI-like enzyme
MQFRAQHDQYMEHYKGATFDIVEAGEVQTGRLYVYRSAREIRIVEIAMLPEHRGTGTGTQLLDQLIRESNDSRRPLTIHVERNNPALHWYERHGFRTVEDKGVYLFMERPYDAPM